MNITFNAEGTLPEGVYEMSMEEFMRQFVYNEKRQIIFKGFLTLISDLKAIKCKAVYVDGSFVTIKEQPGDVDVCWEDDEDIDWDLLDALIIRFFWTWILREKLSSCDIVQMYFRQIFSKVDLDYYLKNFFNRIKKQESERNY